MIITSPVVAILVGLWLGLLGYATFRVAAVLFGMAVGISIGYQAGMYFAPWAAVLLGAGGGLLGVLLCFSAVLVPLFVFGFSTGFGTGAYLCTVFGPVPQAATWLIAFFSGLLLGLFCLRLRRPLIIYGTSFVGAGLCTEAVLGSFAGGSHGTVLFFWRPLLLLPMTDYAGVSAARSGLTLAVWVILSIVFARVQVRASRRRIIRQLSGDRYV